MKEAVRKLTILLKEGGEFRDIQLGIKRDKKEDDGVVADKVVEQEEVKEIKKQKKEEEKEEQEEAKEEADEAVEK